MLRRFWAEKRTGSMKQRTRSSLRRLVVEPLEDRVLPAVLDLAAGVRDGDSGSLRQSMIVANTNSEDDEIRLAAGTYELSLPGGEEDGSASGDLDLTEVGHSVTIRGAGAESTIIDATFLNDRILHVLSGASVILIGVTIRGGSGVDDGGGIFNEGDLAIQDGRVEQNSAINGGGIYNAGKLSIDTTIVTGNRAAERGGGIHNTGWLTYATVDISGNAAGVSDAEIMNAATMERDGGVFFSKYATDALAIGGFVDESRGDFLVDRGRASIDSDGLGSTTELSGFQAGTLTAGSIDDHEDYAAFVEFVTGVLPSLSSEFDQFQFGQMVMIRVQNEEGSPIGDAAVTLRGVDEQGEATGEILLSLTSGSDGRAMFLTALDALEDGTQFAITVTSPDGSEVVNEVHSVSESLWDITLSESESELPTQLDLALVIDTTGSMGDELEFLKVEIDSIVTQVRELYPDVDMRFSVVAYRDAGDLYVTRSFAFTDSLEEVRATLANQAANGGGDMPEAMHLALEDALDFEWRSGNTARVLFLVADAPPHHQYMSRTFDAVEGLRNQGVRIFPVASSGIDKAAEFMMRSAALITMGEYLFLTNHSGYGSSHADPTTSEYDVETLSQLMIRMIGAELAGHKIAAENVIEHVVLTDDEPSVPAGEGEAILDVLANDDIPESADLRIIETSPTSHGGRVEIASDGLTVTYCPPAHFIGTDTFEYTVELASGEQEHAVVSVAVSWAWRNEVDPNDVDGDGHVSPLDVLVLLNRNRYFGSMATGDLETHYAVPATNDSNGLAHVDVNGDGHMAPDDILVVINMIRRMNRQATAASVSEYEATGDESTL